ncbi:N-formylglutamate amidohydrolase [Tsuneonella sp. HG222]
MTLKMRESTMDQPTADAGGTIPGTAGDAAFTIRRAVPSAIPVVIAVPHAGRNYPQWLLDRMREPHAAGLRLEDRYVDLLGEQVAAATGAGLIVAEAPRAMIDLNRAPDDMDWDMLAEGRPEAAILRTGRRARGGLGLVPRRLPGMGEIWRGRMSQDDLESRIAGVHAPYHAALALELADVRKRWGCALLIDLHSMPPLSARRGTAAAEFVLGDRFGSSCAGALCAATFDHFGTEGRRTAHNRPYAGGYVLDRHCAPSRGIHGFQLEVCRSAYLDAGLREPAASLQSVGDLISGLVRRLADEMAALARPIALAAE